MKKATRNFHPKSRIALLLGDVINHFEFPDGKDVLRRALAKVVISSSLRLGALHG